jgi:hypothetical protein
MSVTGTCRQSHVCIEIATLGLYEITAELTCFQFWLFKLTEFFRFVVIGHSLGPINPIMLLDILQITLPYMCDASHFWYYSFPKSLTLFQTPNLPTISAFFVMSTNWSVLFYQTLAEYVQQYIEAQGDPAARAQVLKNCQEVITMSSLHKEQSVELPQHLDWVSISSYWVTCPGSNY